MLISIFIALIISLIFIYLFIGNVIYVWLETNTFWNRVAFRQRNGEKFDIEYSFHISNIVMIGFVFAIPTMLWCVIKLATII